MMEEAKCEKREICKNSSMFGRKLKYNYNTDIIKTHYCENWSTGYTSPAILPLISI